MKKIIMKFDLTSGEVKVEADGFKGSSCQEATKFLETLGQGKNFQKKMEWYEQSLELQGKFNTNICG